MAFPRIKSLRTFKIRNSTTITRNLQQSTFYYQETKSDPFVLPELKDEHDLRYDTSKRVYLKPNQIYNKTKNKKKTRKNVSTHNNSSPSIDRSFLRGLKELSPEATEKANDIVKSIDSYQPVDTSIGKKRFDRIIANMSKAFTKDQLYSYYDTYKENNPESEVCISRGLTKNELLESILLNVWKINKSESLVLNDILETRHLELKKHEAFFLDPKRSHLYEEMNSMKVKAKLLSNRMSISGTESNLNFIEAEIRKFLDSIQSQSFDMTLLKLNNHTKTQVEELAKVYFEKMEESNYTIYGKTQADINLAKRLLSWSYESNPHVKYEVFRPRRLMNYSYVPFKMDEILPWHYRKSNYFSIVKEDYKPVNELIFDKFDKISDFFINSKVLERLPDARFDMGVRKYKDIMERVLSMDDLHHNNKFIPDDDFKLSEETKFADLVEPVEPQPEVSAEEASPRESVSETSPKESTGETLPDLDKIKNIEEGFEGLDKFRTELGLFSEQEVDANEFPSIAKLVEDFEAADSKTNDLESFRKELNNFTTKDDAEPEMNVLDELLDLETKTNDQTKWKKRVDISEYLSYTQILEMYKQVSDVSYVDKLKGVGKDSILSSAYTLQFGSLVLKSYRPSKGLFPVAPKVSAKSDFKFISLAPFVNDLTTSLPLVATNTDKPYTSSIQIRLVPSMYQTDENGQTVLSDQTADYPPVEIQCEVNSRGTLALDTLQVLSLEAQHNVAVNLPNLVSDMEISRLVLGNLFPEQAESMEEKFSHQPDLEKFLEKSKLNFSGSNNVEVHPSLTLKFKDTEVKYDYLHISYKTDFLFEYNEREVVYSIIEGGDLGGRRCEIMIGAGELSFYEFRDLVVDAVELINKV
ncbi:Sigma-like sequence protein, mitochondrial, putative [Candida maltosa Xu316]|uniref:Sigma-like sequence protein, mitochondrial, putative n=1 Tax=Candida maltosa (strain Xu316) TaxID=1245528 RepID=M3JVZ2_CANMX|nr:Sigma-like sequence protein, mitochondrial, putative [Candida maltosa Xu316]